MKLIDMTPTLYEPEKAEAIAAEVGAGDPDWTYTADHDPKGTGYSRVKVEDEEGELIGFL